MQRENALVGPPLLAAFPVHADAREPRRRVVPVAYNGLMEKTLVIMAAGAGSRFGGPKQTTPVGPQGEWLLEYALFDAARAGFDRAVCIIRDELEPDFRRLAGKVGSGASRRAASRSAWTTFPPGSRPAGRAKPWGTGHAVLTVRDVVRTPFAIMNADDFYGADAYRLGAEAADLAGAEGVASVIAMRLDRTLSPYGPVKRGWCQTRDGTRDPARGSDGHRPARRPPRRRRAGMPSTTFDGSELVSMNFWVFPPSVFSLLATKFEAFLRDHRAKARQPSSCCQRSSTN